MLGSLLSPLAPFVAVAHRSLQGTMGGHATASMHLPPFWHWAWPRAYTGHVYWLAEIYKTTGERRH